MGKVLIIKGADFSRVAIEDGGVRVINFDTANLKNHNIAQGSVDGVLRLITPTSGNPSFYEINCEGYNYFIVTVSEGRFLFTNEVLPAKASTPGIDIESYLANTIEDSYFSEYTGTKSIIQIPENSKYLYIRRTYASGQSTLPSYAALSNNIDS